MLQIFYLEGQDECSDRPASGMKVSVFGCSLEFEKFQNSFSDTEIASNRLDALRLHTDAVQRTLN